MYVVCFDVLCWFDVLNDNRPRPSAWATACIAWVNALSMQVRLARPPSFFIQDGGMRCLEQKWKPSWSWSDANPTAFFFPIETLISRAYNDSECAQWARIRGISSATFMSSSQRRRMRTRLVYRRAGKPCATITYKRLAINSTCVSSWRWTPRPALISPLWRVLNKLMYDRKPHTKRADYTRCMQSLPYSAGIFTNYRVQVKQSVKYWVLCPCFRTTTFQADQFSTYIFDMLVYFGTISLKVKDQSSRSQEKNKCLATAWITGHIRTMAEK